MHDLHLADKIIKKVLEFANGHNFKKVEKVYIKIGDILEHSELIKSKTLKFNLKMLAKDSQAENAEFIIEKFDKKGEYSIEAIEGE